jgi:3-oxoacyl-[acyl-carrier-protein] synthase III
VVRSDFYSFPHLVDAFGCLAGIDLLRAEGRLERNWWSVAIRDDEVYGELRTTNFSLGARSIERSLEAAGWTVESLRWLVPDNVSTKVGEELASRLGLPVERVLAENCVRYGHAFVADLFVNLTTILDRHPLQPGDRLACIGMGLGQHWGVLLLEA